ncbi:MAG: O-antigen ligase family protein [Candidatus Omnitrophota bacterium]|nr:O-antigen ligase family protein [Candidatus Omnitrophota bacterium]
MLYDGLYFILVLIVLLLTIRRLLYGVFLLIVLLPLERFMVTKTLGLNIKLAEWMGLVCIIIFLWNFMVKPQKKMFIQPILTPLLIFVFVNILLLLINLPSLIASGSIEDFNSPGFRSIKVVIWCVYSILVALAVCYAIKDKRDLKNCIGVFLGIVMLISTLSLLSMILNLVGVKFMTWALIGRIGFIGIKATFSEPAYFSHYISSILPVALLIFIVRIYRLGTFFTILACFILLLAGYFSFSTTGLAGMTLMLFIIPFLIRRYRLLTVGKGMRYMVMIILSLYIVFFIGALFNIDFVRVTVMNYFEKVITPETRSAGRAMGLKMFSDHPFVGFGPGNWAWHAQQTYRPVILKEIFVRPSYNCLYFEILVDLGILGFIPFLWFFLAFFKQFSKAIRATDDVFLKTVAVGFIVGFVALLGEYYVAFNFYRIYVWVIFGIAMAAIRLAKEDKKTA